MRNRKQDTIRSSCFPGWANLLICLFTNLLILSGCDNDDRYYPVTEQQFLLVGESDRQLLHLEQGELIDDWLSQQGWSAELSDMDAKGNIFWFASAQSKELFRWDGIENSGEAFPLDNFQPHTVLIGEPYLLLIDTVNQLLGFWDYESTSMLVEVPWTAGIGENVYISGKYFVQKGERQIEVFLETSLQSAAIIDFERNIQHVQVNASKTLYVLSADSQVYQHFISYFSYTPVLEPTRISDYDRVLVTPYLRNQYGKEWLTNIWERNQILFSRAPNFRIAEAVNSYAIDFFEGEILYQQNDSLYRYLLQDQQAEYIDVLSLPIQKYRAFREASGQ